MVYVVGMALVYAALGVVTALLGKTFGNFTRNPWIYGGVGVVILFFGLAMLDLFMIHSVPGLAGDPDTRACSAAVTRRAADGAGRGFRRGALHGARCWACCWSTSPGRANVVWGGTLAAGVRAGAGFPADAAGDLLRDAVESAEGRQRGWTGSRRASDTLMLAHRRGGSCIRRSKMFVGRRPMNGPRGRRESAVRCSGCGGRRDAGSPQIDLELAGSAGRQPVRLPVRLRRCCTSSSSPRGVRPAVDGAAAIWPRSRHAGSRAATGWC